MAEIHLGHIDELMVEIVQSQESYTEALKQAVTNRGSATILAAERAQLRYLTRIHEAKTYLPQLSNSQLSEEVGWLFRPMVDGKQIGIASFQRQKPSLLPPSLTLP